MAAGQRDIPVLLQPGSGATVRAPGEFMYLAFADREILAIVTGQDGTQSRLKMVTGDFTKPAGGIEEVELVNPDPNNACAVTVIIGAGEFDRKIIQGEVTITPGIRGADGQFVDDTRSTVRLRVAIGNIEPREYVAGDLISTTTVGDKFHVCTVLPGERLLVAAAQNNRYGEFKLVRNYRSAPTVEDVVGDFGLAQGAVIGAELVMPGVVLIGGTWFLQIRRYDAVTLQQRAAITTDIVCVFQFTWGIWAATYAPESGHFWVGHHNDIRILDPADGALVKTIEGGGGTAGLIYRNGIVHRVATDGNIFACYDAVTMQEVSIEAATLPDRGGPYDYGGGAFDDDHDEVVTSGLSDDDVVRVAVEDITITASGSVTSCAGGGFLKSSPIDTQAEIYTQRLDDGRVLMSGEILRAALEIYTGRYMPANYLDYVYRVRAENLNGISPRTVDSGGKSFLAAGIPDDASGTFPQTLEITLREGLL